MSYLLVAFWLTYLWRLAPDEPISSRTRRLTVVLLVGTCLLMFVHYVLPIERLDIFPIDDSYITLTAQRNLAQRNLFAVNPAAPLAGITSPLHVATVGMMAKLIPLTIATRFFGLLTYLALCLGVLTWSRLLGARWRTATAAAALVAVSGQMTAHALNGLETVFFSALVMWCFAVNELARARPRYWYLLGLLVGLTILTRPEGWFVAAALYIVAVIANLHRRDALVRTVVSGLIAAAVVAPYLIANYVVLDSFFPLTVSAKKYFFAEMCAPWAGRFHTLRLALARLFGMLLFVAPLLLFARSFLRRIYPLLFVVLFYAAYLLQFPGALLHYGGRYNHSLAPILITGLVLGAESLLRWSRRFPRWVPRLLVIGLVAYFAWTAALEGDLHRKGYQLRLHQTRRYLLSVVKWIKQNSAPGDLIAAHDIGALYYFGNRRVLDLVGLTDPEVAHLHADLANPCGDRALRKIALYMLLEERRPKIISMFRTWDKFFLGLLNHDQGRHLREVGHLGVKKTTIMYYFYECDWDRDLRPAGAPALVLPLNVDRSTIPEM